MSSPAPGSDSTSSRVSSPAATGGAGTTFEQHVGAYWLAQLLVGAIPPVLIECGLAPGQAQRPPETRVAWRAMAKTARLPAISASLDAVKLFEIASRSVWLVVAAASVGELEQGKNVSLGSAVAVTSSWLFTNCHVIDRKPVVWIKQAEVIEQARLVSEDEKTDRCVLSVEERMLSPVRGMRSYQDLRVGEEVFTIGAPSGLEASLAQGVIAGLRSSEHRRFIQTTAPISPGSSGGGLFDKAANLIGITTFRVRDGQSLNFAIAVDDYFQ